jgi:DtxR family Mn-dependent transcriptional regulator
VADSALTELPAGTTGTVSRVTSDDEKAIAYLAGLGIEPGVALAVEGVSPFDGPVAVRLGVAVHHLGRRLAQAIHVAERAPSARSTASAAKPAGRRARR